MPTSFKADTIRVNNLESTGSVGSAGNRWSVIKVSSSFHMLNTSSIRFNDSTEVSSSKAGVLNFYAVDTYFSSSVKIVNLTASHTHIPTGVTYLAGGSNISITTASNGQITIATTGTGSTLDQAYRQGGAGAGAVITVNGQPVQFQAAGTQATAFVVTGNVLFGTGTLPTLATDVYFFVSGAINSKDNPIANAHTRSIPLFGGDVQISGGLYFGSSNNIIRDLSSIVRTGSITIETRGSSAHFTVTPGGNAKIDAGNNVDIDAIGQVTIDSAGASGIGITAAGSGPASLQAGGTVTVSSTANKAVIMSGSVIEMSTSVSLQTTNPLRFDTSAVQMSASRPGVLNLVTTDFFMSGSIQALNLTGAIHRLPSGVSYLAAGANVTITSGANSQITIAVPSAGGTLDQSYDVGGTGKGAQIFVDGQPIQMSVTGATSTVALAVTGVFIQGTGSSLLGPPQFGTDITCYISGVAGSRGTSTPGTAFFAGDIAASGNLFYASQSFGYYRMSAADFIVSNASAGSFTTNTGSITASFWQNNSGQTMQARAALHVPHGSTIREVLVHLSKSNNSDSVLTLLRQDTTGTLQTQVANTVHALQGEFINMKFTNLSESVNLPGAAVQNAYYVVIAFGNDGAGQHKFFGGHCKYEYNTIYI